MLLLHLLLYPFPDGNFFCGTDKVFGPATTTRHVYDVAAQHVVSGAMEGINGNYFSKSHIFSAHIYAIYFCYVEL